MDGLANLQTAVGLGQPEGIEDFNKGPQHNARILTENLFGSREIGLPRLEEGERICFKCALSGRLEQRDNLRRCPSKHGIVTKTTDGPNIPYRNLIATRTPSPRRKRGRTINNQQVDGFDLQ